MPSIEFTSFLFQVPTIDSVSLLKFMRSFLALDLFIILLYQSSFSSSVIMQSSLPHFLLILSIFVSRRLVVWSAHASNPMQLIDGMVASDSTRLARPTPLGVLQPIKLAPMPTRECVQVELNSLTSSCLDSIRRIMCLEKNGAGFQRRLLLLFMPIVLVH